LENLKIREFKFPIVEDFLTKLKKNIIIKILLILKIYFFSGDIFLLTLIKVHLL